MWKNLPPHSVGPNCVRPFFLFHIVAPISSTNLAANGDVEVAVPYKYYFKNYVLPETLLFINAQISSDIPQNLSILLSLHPKKFIIKFFIFFEKMC